MRVALRKTQCIIDEIINQSEANVALIPLSFVTVYAIALFITGKVNLLKTLQRLFSMHSF